MTSDTTPMKPTEPTAAHKAFREELLAAFKKHAADTPADELLAIAAHLVGQIMAYQDQNKFTSAMVIDIVRANIEHGNAEAIALVASAGGTKQ